MRVLIRFLQKHTPDALLQTREYSVSSPAACSNGEISSPVLPAVKQTALILYAAALSDK